MVQTNHKNNTNKYTVSVERETRESVKHDEQSIVNGTIQLMKRCSIETGTQMIHIECNVKKEGELNMIEGKTNR